MDMGVINSVLCYVAVGGCWGKLLEAREYKKNLVITCCYFLLFYLCSICILYFSRVLIIPIIYSLTFLSILFLSIFMEPLPPPPYLIAFFFLISYQISPA